MCIRDRDTGKAPGADWVITPKIDQWLKETILNTTPADHGYDTVLWTLEIIVNLLKERFNPVSYTHLDVYKRQVILREKLKP